jgi:hypothetical protein
MVLGESVSRPRMHPPVRVSDGLRGVTALPFSPFALFRGLECNPFSPTSLESTK